MMIRAVVPLVLVTCLICRIQTGLAAEADDLTDRTYSLDDIVALAMEHSPALASAEGLVKQSHGRQIAAEAYPNPSVAGTLGRGAIRDPSNGIRVTERTFTVEQPIEWGGKRQARREVADAGFAEASATLEVAKLTVVADVKEAFYRLLFAQPDAELAIQNVATVEEVLRTVRARVAAGEATSFDTLKAGVEVQKAQKEVARAQNELVVARTRLNTLTTGVVGKQFSIRGDFRSLRPGADLERLADQAMENHPVVRRLTKRAEQAGHAVHYERAARVPNVTIQGMYHREAGDESLVAGISVPLPLWYRRQGEIETALGGKYHAEAERVKAQYELAQSITQHVQEVRTAQDQLKVFEGGLLMQAEQTLAVARTSFREGASGLLDVLDAQRVFRQTQLEYAQVRAGLSIALARLERAMGMPL